jgi:hypothetical protein
MARKRLRAATVHAKAKARGIEALGGYDAQSERQGASCAICGHRQKPGQLRLSIDHDHRTMAVRGLLCQKCNRMLGWARDNPDILLTASYYLSWGWQAACAYRDACRTMKP